MTRLQTFATLVALLIPMLIGGAGAMASERELRDFDSAEERERYQRLLQEVRCMVCQNESLSSSQADLAQDLRDEIYRMVRDGYTRDETVEFLVARYGDFVLYRPPMTPKTWLLWFGPLLLLAAALIIATMVVRNHRSDARSELSAAEQARARQLLDSGADIPQADPTSTDTHTADDHDHRGPS